MYKTLNKLAMEDIVQIYKNLSGNSDVLAFKLGKDFVKILYKSGLFYHYTEVSAGADAIKSMQQLAIQGLGLETYIRSNPQIKFYRVT